MLSDEKKSWLAAVLKVPVERMAPVDMIPRAKGEKYKDEEKKGGWRGGKSKVNQEATHKVTHHFDDQERADNTVAFEDGTAKLPSGHKPGRNNLYAIDPKTGEVVLDGGRPAILRDLDEKGNATDKFEAIGLGEGIARVDKDKKGKRLEIYHHTSMLKGEDVGGAGHMSFDRKGKVTSVDNDSGHYTPRFVQLLQTVEHLMKQGMLLDQTLVDYLGKAVTETSEEFKLYEKVRPIFANLPKERDRLAEILHKLEAPDVTSEQETKLLLAGDKIFKRVEKAQEAMAVLRKMGIGPSMKIDSSATVGFISAEEGVQGQDFKQKATRKDMKVDEFLMGTGATGTSKNPSRGSLESEDDKDEGSEDTKLNAYLETNYGKKSSGRYDLHKSRRGDEREESEDQSESGDEGKGGDGPKSKSSPRVAHRDGGAKSDMLDELKEVVAKRRPERRKKEGSVFTGEVPKVDRTAWLKDVSKLSDELDKLNGDGEEEGLSPEPDRGHLGDKEDKTENSPSSKNYFDEIDEEDRVVERSSGYDDPSSRGRASTKDVKKGKKKIVKTEDVNPYVTRVDEVDEDKPYAEFVPSQESDDD